MKDSERPAGLWCPDLDWLLNASDAALGARGTLASVIAAIERGGAGAAGDCDELMLQRVGYADRKNPSVRRAKRLGAAWALVPDASRRRLRVHYGSRLGAGDTHHRDDGVRRRSRAEEYVGFCAAVALYIAENPGELAAALAAPHKGQHQRIITAARRAGEQAVRQDHAAWHRAQRQQAEAWLDDESAEPLEALVPPKSRVDDLLEQAKRIARRQHG